MPDEQSVEDVYVDAVQMTVSAYGVAMTLSRNPAHPGPSQPVAEPMVTVRTSLEHAKVMAMLLRKNLKAFERDNGEIPIPPEVYAGLGVAKEDWGL